MQEGFNQLPQSRFIQIKDEVINTEQIQSACPGSNEDRVWVEITFVGGGFVNLECTDITDAKAQLEKLLDL